MKGIILFTILFCLILFTQPGTCQNDEAQDHNTISGNEEHKENEHEKFSRGRFAPVLGYSWIPKGDHVTGDLSGIIVAPVVGFDLEYFVIERLTVGLYVDLEILAYEVDRGDGDYIEREFPLIIEAGGTYEFVKNWLIFGAVGYEIEHSESFAVASLGINREFRLQNKWDITPMLVYTFKPGFGSLKLAVAFGKRFK